MSHPHDASNTTYTASLLFCYCQDGSPSDPVRSRASQPTPFTLQMPSFLDGQCRELSTAPLSHRDAFCRSAALPISVRHAASPRRKVPRPAKPASLRLTAHRWRFLRRACLWNLGDFTVVSSFCPDGLCAMPAARAGSVDCPATCRSGHAAVPRFRNSPGKRQIQVFPDMCR